MKKTEVVNLVKQVKEDFPSYKFYAVGSWVRRNPNFKDYDINIVPPNGKRSPSNIKEWSKLLKRFDNKEFDGKKIDAQILPSLNKLLKMNAKEIKERRNNIHFRYFYSEGNRIPKTNALKVIKLKNNMWMSISRVIPNKLRAKNLDNSIIQHKEL